VEWTAIKSSEFLGDDAGEVDGQGGVTGWDLLGPDELNVVVHAALNKSRNKVLSIGVVQVDGGDIESRGHVNDQIALLGC